MRQVYSLLLLAAMGFAGFTGEAKTFTISVDNPDAVVVRDPSNGYNPIDFSAGNSQTITVDDSAYSLPVSANSGFLISSVKDAAGTSVVDSYPTLPADNAQIVVSMVNDGTTVSIATEEKKAKVFTFIGNPEHVRINMDYSDLTAVDGQWVITPGDYSYINIYANTGYLLRGITDEGGNFTPAYGGNLQIYAGSYTASQTFTINSCSEAEVRTAGFTVEVEGNPGDVSLQRNSDNAQIPLSEASTGIAFDPANETGWTLSHTVYGKVLYSVAVGDDQIALEGTRYSVTVSDGAVIKVKTDFPDKDVPVNISFTNPGTEGVVSGVRVDGSNVSGWNESGFSVKLGSSLSIEANMTDFENVSATLNGQPLGYPSYSATVTSEEALNFVFTATKAAPMHLTVEAVNPQGIRVEKGYTGEAYELTGELTELEIPKSHPYVLVKAADGYLISAIEDANGNTYSSNYGIYVTDGMTLTIVAEEFNRDNKLTLYVGDDSWQYRSFTLSDGKETRVLYSDSQLPVGYSELAFSALDLPFKMSGYPALYAYHNGEKVEAPMYSEPAINSAADGDVVKLFASEPETYSVTYTIADGVDVEVRHDRTLVIENPSVNTVVSPTEVHIVPAAAATRAAGVPLVVKVNELALEADEDGKYVATITGDSTVKVDIDTTSGIDAAAADSQGAARVYNLQGISVGTSGDGRQLPAGVYIVGGKKVRL